MSAPSAPPSKLAPSILIVDDTPINLQLLSTMLTQRGFRARPVTSGKGALAAAEAERPDLILMDVSMPEMNGYEACERIKALPTLRDIPVIFLSALSQSEDKMRAFRAGGVDYITKPFLIEEIDARINAHLRAAQQHREVIRHKQQLEEAVAARTQDLNAAYHTLQQTDRVKRDFLLMISHEMRTPSNGLLGTADYLLEMCPDTDETRTMKGLYEASRDRLLRLLDDCQYLISMEDKPQSATPESCAASWFVALLTEELGVQAAPGVLPLDARLPASQDELMQLIRRVLSLARAFMKSGSELLAQLQLREGAITLSFELNDLGIDPKSCSEFFSVGSAVRTSSKAESLGLSPVIARRIAQQCSGSITLQPSAPGLGRLEMRLPWC